MRFVVRTVRLAGVVSAMIAGASTLATGLAAQGISYTLAPAGASISWDKDLGLKNHSLYGGQASIDFERLVSLQGYYLTNDKINTAVDRLGLNGDLANKLVNQRLNVRSMGANVIWKFWPGGVAPFIKTGGGIVEIRPDSGHSTKQIALNVGGGLRFGANAPLFLDLFAEDMMLRVDRYALFNPGATGLPVDPQAKDLRHNMVVGAAVGVPLGLHADASEESSDLRWGLAGASLTLEPFAGRLMFDNKTNTSPENVALRDQELAGLRAGIDVGRYVGVRGFYWRGADKNFKRFESLQSWGGELQFRLNSSPGLTPYLLAGAAQLDFKASDTTARAQHSADKSSLILGGGLSLPFGERLAINVTARDYLYGQGNGADSVSSPSDLRNNWMVTAGLRVSIAGHSGSRTAERTVMRERELRAQLHADSMRYLGRGDARNDSRNGRGRGDSATRMAMGDSAMMMDSTGRMRAAPRAGSVITVPVPTVGEFYVRYGPPQGMATTLPQLPGSPADSAARRAAAMGAGASPEDMRELVRSIVRQELNASMSGINDSARAASMTAAERDAFMNRRIDSIVATRVNASNVPTVVMTPDASRPVVVQQTGNRYSWTGDDRRGGLMVYSGLTVNAGTQLSLGGRFDLGPITGNSPIDFVPEIAIGGGSGGRSTMIVGNAQYTFRKVHVGTNTLIQPHVIAGVGILNFSDRVGTREGLQGVINLGYGASIPLTHGAANRAGPVLTLEHQGIDFFQLNRLLVGLSWRM